MIAKDAQLDTTYRFVSTLMVVKLAIVKVLYLSV